MEGVRGSGQQLWQVLREGPQPLEALEIRFGREPLSAMITQLWAAGWFTRVNGSALELASWAEPLWPHIWQAGLRTDRFGRQVRYLWKVGSTQSVAEQCAVDGMPEGFMVVAEFQEAGRGRQSRSWQADPGTAVLCSTILRPSQPLGRLSGLSPAMALAVAQAVEAVCGVRCQVKWPNDVFLQGRKLAGVLLDMRVTGSHIEWGLLGLGINVNQPEMPAELGAISLRQATGSEVSRATLLAALCFSLERTYTELQQEGFAALRASYVSRLWRLDEQVRVHSNSAISGRLVDVDAQGCLCLQTEDGARIVSTGEIGAW